MELQSASSAAIADLNGDGKPDIVMGASGEVPTTIALGNGDGTFSPQTLTIPDALGLGGQSVVIADLNGDGKADLVTAFGPATIAVALGDGDGTFQAFTMYPVLPGVAATPETAHLAFVAIGDLNGDGIPDIATASGSILFGDGKGAFPTRRDYVPSGSGSVMIADFDGDGIPDLIFGNGNATFFSGSALDRSATILFGAGEGQFVGAPVSGVNSAQNYEAFAVADFNGDGIPDVVLGSALTNTTFQLTTFLGKGNGLFSAGATQSFSEFDMTNGVVADFNHDGKPDIAFLADTDLSEINVVIFFGHGDGSFAAPLSIPVLDSSINFMAAPDLNGDGIPDLVLTGTATLYVWLGKGNGTFTPTFTTAVTNPSVAFGDFNGDGILDIAVANAASTTVSVLLGKGDGTFPNVTATTLPSAALGHPGMIAAADFDCKGPLDLAVELGAPGNGPFEIAVLSGKGDGTFPTIHITPGATLGLVADVNGDRIPDLIGSGANGALVAQLGNGDGTFQPESVIYSLAHSFAVADVNHDGAPDVVMVAQWGITAFLNIKPALDHGRDHRPIN